MAKTKRDVLEGLSGYTWGPWRPGREDMQSYDGVTGEAFGSVYADDPEGRFHMGERLPRVIARAPGEDCKANAQLIARAPELVEEIRELRAALQHMYDAAQANCYDRPPLECRRIWQEHCDRARALLPDTEDTDA